MIWAVALILAANLALVAISPALARRLPPATSTRLIGLAAWVGAGATAFVVAVICFDFLAQFAPVAFVGQWSAATLRSDDRIPVGWGAAALVALTVAGWTAVRRALGISTQLWMAARSCHQLSGRDRRLVVVEDPHPDAYAVPGLWSGRIVVTSSMLATLNGDERRVLLAHEDSHLRHRHHLYVALTDLAAAVNPMLRALPPLVRRTIERWADEDAALVGGDRVVAAGAVARPGLADQRPPALPRPAVMAMTSGSAPDRALALLRPRPSGRPALAAAAAGLILLVGVGAVSVSHATERRFERAHAAYVDHWRR